MHFDGCDDLFSLIRCTDGRLEYVLLDRDARFANLRGYRAFDLERPNASTALFGDGRTPDVIFCDPPFANFPLTALRAVVDELTPALDWEVVVLDARLLVQAALVHTVDYMRDVAEPQRLVVLRSVDSANVDLAAAGTGDTAGVLG